ncbi:hemolysin family protein [Desulforhabdus sp. TSK]|uniref:hemolysin family protein n=1 Tax=Desulforhabdus sp. TSK TaxID=2925014 RepID=UPI001FC7DBAA|nr:hemolysin family protein [Desulforhabdus sp. TSK]GKT10182.1 ion transporter [Desulforhabdus sp. TSK]
MEEESAKGFQNWLRMCFRRLARVGESENIEKEIQQLIDEGEERGLISEDEGEMIQGIFSFRDTIAREIMVPRTDAVYVRVDAGLSEIIQIILQSGHSRIPIYQENIDNIVGTLHAKDLLNYWGQSSLDLTTIMRPPYFIPETKKISDVLKDLRINKSHMAIVLDEYGGTAGILTLEDIIEEIIGDVMDEYDAEENLMVEFDDGSLLVNARLDVEELEDYLNIELPEGKFESVGGFVISLLGKVPAVNERLVYQDIEMIVESADNRKIETIRVRKIHPDSSATESLDGSSD